MVVQIFCNYFPPLCGNVKACSRLDHSIRVWSNWFHKINGWDHKLESLGNCNSLVAELVSFEKSKPEKAFNLIGRAINDKIDDCLICLTTIRQLSDICRTTVGHLSNNCLRTARQLHDYFRQETYGLMRLPVAMRSLKVPLIPLQFTL